MKALYYPSFDQLEIAELPVPAVAHDEVLIKVHACGICGSELETFKARSERRTPPLVMGHEFCGEIVETGTGVVDWRPGDRVVSNSLVPCGACVRCGRGDTHLCAKRQVFGMHRVGAFAEYVNVPARILIPWPVGIPAEMACLAEPLGNGVHVVELIRHLRPQKVLIIGAGPIGLMCQQAVQIMLGAETIVTDLSAERREVAKRLGAVAVFDPMQSRRQANVHEISTGEQVEIESNPSITNDEILHGDVDLVDFISTWTSGEGADVVIDAVGASTTKRQSLELLRPGGAAVWIGLHGNEMSLDTYGITLPEKFVYGTYAARIEDLSVAIDMMSKNQIETASWVQTWPLEKGVEAFNTVLEGKGIKAVIRSQINDQ